MSQTLGARFHALDGLRFVGALAVLTTHVGFDSGAALRGPFAGMLSRLDAGVALFFVVSGFLLFRPHAMAHLQDRHRPRTRPYLVKRAARIMPALWLAVGLAALVARGTDSTPGDYLAHASLTQIYLGTPLTPGLTQFWSLATEVAFYLCLPGIAALICRGPRDARWCHRVVLGCAVMPFVGAGWMALSTAVGVSDARLWLPGFLGWFAVGIALATWHAGRTTGLLGPSRLEDLSQYPWTVWGLGFGLFVLASTALGGPLDLSEPTPGQAATKSLMYAVLGLVVVLPTIVTIPPTREPRALAPLTGRIGIWLGTISYGIFAYHVIVLELLNQVPGLEPFTGGFWVRWLGTLCGGVLLAAASYYAVERPIMRRARTVGLPHAGRA